MHNTVTSSASLARRSLIIWHKIKQLSSMKSSKEKNNPLQCGLVLLHSTEREQQKAVQSMLCVTVHKLSWWLLAAFICLAQWVSRLLSGISTMHTHTCLSPSQPIRKSQKKQKRQEKATTLRWAENIFYKKQKQTPVPVWSSYKTAEKKQVLWSGPSILAVKLYCTSCYSLNKKL